MSRDQLAALGFTDNQILHMAGDGSVHRLHHNVFAVGHRRLNHPAHLFAALLSLGPRAFLSRWTAAAVHGLRSIHLHEVEITIPGTGGRGREGLVLHRTRNDPHPADVRAHGDLRVSSVHAGSSSSRAGRPQPNCARASPRCLHRLPRRVRRRRDLRDLHHFLQIG